MDNWNESVEKEYIERVFVKLPQVGQTVWIRTADGIYKGTFDVEEKVDRLADLGFFVNGKEVDAIAWIPIPEPTQLSTEYGVSSSLCHLPPASDE